eukprot:6183074-Pleurochrysis_carterae.AAC.3
MKCGERAAVSLSDIPRNEETPSSNPSTQCDHKPTTSEVWIDWPLSSSPARGGKRGVLLVMF